MNELINLIDLSQDKPLNEVVFEGFRKAIITGLIPVGERINEKECSEQLNISRTPIRDALRQIEREKLVEYIPRFGVVVKKISLEDAYEIFQIRRSLDILATKNAMKQMTDEDFAETEELLEKTKEANNAGEVERVIRYFSDFNTLIYKFSRMPRLETIVTGLREYLMRFRDISLVESDRRLKALNEHMDIYLMMKNQEYEKVGEAVERHLKYSQKFLIEEIIRVQEGIEG